jgi:hypothetical protein
MDPRKSVVVYRKKPSSLKFNETMPEMAVAPGHDFTDNPLNQSDNGDEKVETEKFNVTIIDIQEQNRFYLKIMNLVLLFYPMVACAYSKALYCKIFS